MRRMRSTTSEQNFPSELLQADDFCRRPQQHTNPPASPAIALLTPRVSAGCYKKQPRRQRSMRLLPRFLEGANIPPEASDSETKGEMVLEWERDQSGDP